MQDLIRIGTRKSRLALVQTNIVRQKIEEAFPGIRVEICEMSTKGDELLGPDIDVLWRKRCFYPGTGGGIAG